MAEQRLSVARRELILGGQKSGKSRRAEMLARDWLAASPAHHAVLIATAQPWDDEMVARIGRHQSDRAARVPGLRTVGEPLALARAIGQHSTPRTLVVVDCLTLWLTNLLMPMHGDQIVHPAQATTNSDAVAALLQAIGDAAGPLVLVGNEIGMGVIPIGREVRAFVDALGRLNQDVAGVCQRVTLMAAGLALSLKDDK